jgi:hypothetical protein
MSTTVHEEVLERTVQRCRDRNIRIPTFAQMRDPGLIPTDIRARLRQTGLWDVDPVNLFRI